MQALALALALVLVLVGPSGAQSDFGNRLFSGNLRCNGTLQLGEHTPWDATAAWCAEYSVPRPRAAAARPARGVPMHVPPRIPPVLRHPIVLCVRAVDPRRGRG